MNILINGAGIAGPTLAYWLARFGFRPTLLEVAPQLRTGGYIIDFWGLGYDVAEKMGLIPGLQAQGYLLEEVRLVDAHGRKTGGFNAKTFARAANNRYTTLPRSALSSALYQAAADSTETIFGDELTALDMTSTGVRASFRRTPARNFDLVIGAGGLHSRVRSLAFKKQLDVTRYLGYKVAAFEIANYPHRDELVYVAHAAPGRQAARFSLKDGGTLVLLVAADADDAVPISDADKRLYLHRRFDDMGWECPEIMAAMDSAETLYFDNASQVHAPAWSNDRIALVGDAAACPSLLAGEGAGLAMAEAYVLAGELHRAGGDHHSAFRRYEEMLRPFLEQKQNAARRFASSFAPKTAFGIALRNWVTRAMSLPLVADMALGASVRDDFLLPAYD